MVFVRSKKINGPHISTFHLRKLY